MLTIDQIASYFPGPLYKKNKQGALAEYLQYELLDSIFKNRDSADLSFIGGTAIRLLHQSFRFSEDIDFDNFGLKFERFEFLIKAALRDMEYKVFNIEYRIIKRGAFHCYIKFPELLYIMGISNDRGRKITIRIDSETKEKLYDPKDIIINKFALFRRIMAAPPEILLSQKMMTVLSRKREKGRDLFDVSFLMGLTAPDFLYIERCIGLCERDFLRLFTERIQELDLEFLAKDVEPFLFSAEQKERILHFRDYWKIQQKIYEKIIG